MKQFTLRKRKKDKTLLNEPRSCFICHHKFHFNEYQNIYLYLSSIKNPVENFFNILNNKGEFNFIADINITKIWRNSKNKVFCPSCLIDFKHAYNLKRKCIKCGKDINEYDSDLKWCMIITKKGQKIIEFECFHFQCWKGFFEESVGAEMER